jgi:hypothetical protein
MIEAHLLDSWTRDADRQDAGYRIALLAGGLGSVLFLLLAGTAAAMSAGSKWRRSSDAAAASAAVARRGLEIFGLAFLFRLQAWILGWSPNARDLLKVDVLNIMGPSIVVVALLWRSVRASWARCALFAVAAVLSALFAPVTRTISLSAVAEPLRAYVVPVEGLSNFVFFPWIGFVFAGAIIGVLIDGTAAGPAERRLNVGLALGGVLLAGAAYAASLAPSAFDGSHFWTSSPAFFFMRVGIVMITIAVAYAWTERRAPAGKWNPVIQLGESSLFIYWIHVEMVYGLISRPVHRTLSLPQAWLAYAVFTAFMLACSLVKDRVRDQIRQSRNRATAAA